MLSSKEWVIKNADLTNYNTYGIHTKTKYLAKPNSREELKGLVEIINNENIKYFVLGGGSNVILSDKMYDGVIISLENLNNINIDNTKVEVDAGIVLGKFIMECINNSLGGLEYLALIPGTLGGALYGNAGVSDKCIYDYLETITILKDNEFKTLNKVEIKYSYRHSMFKENNDIIIGATFKLYKDDINELKNKVKENRIKRLNSQPLEYKNAGSVFKNPEGNYAGALIEGAGLKGYSVGDAEVSMKHANFIINKGNASGEDIRNLIANIQEKVYDKYNIKLELEQIVIDWE